MKNKAHIFLVIVSTFVMTSLPGIMVCGEEEASSNESYSITLTPAKYVSVIGDDKKFRAHQWMNEGYSGGIKHLSFSKAYENDTLMEFEGRVFPDENDNIAHLVLTNEEVGEFDLSYKSFRKYYDDSGGFYEPFGTLDISHLGRDLEMDIGNLYLSMSPAITDTSGLTFIFERHTKNGDKSRLTWAEAVEGGTFREITPSWQSIEEETNAFALQGNTTVSGFNLNAEQRYEHTLLSSRRYERWLSTNATASEKKMRFHDQDPETKIHTTTMEGNKWFDDDTSYAGIAYRYANLSSKELENITETNEFGTPQNFGGGSKTRINAIADNDVDDHTFVSHYMKQITPTFSVSAKAKNQVMKRKGESTYPYDTSASPDGVIDAIDYSFSRNKLLNFGQNFAFQYSGLKKTSIYGDIELNEMRNNIKERQENIARVFQWERISKAKTKKATYTLGSRIIPSRYVNMTIQGRRKYEDNDYEDAVDTSGAINSAFVDSLKIFGDEATTKLTWKPLNWFENSLRYQFDRKNYETRVQALDSTPVGRYLSHTITYDIFLQPIEDILLNLSYSFQDAKISTPAAASSDAAALPGFNADVQSFMLSSSYTPSEALSYTASFGYTMSDNFNDFLSTGLPLGVSNSYYNSEVSLSYRPTKKDWTIEPHYGYYHYDTSSVAEYGNYIAHVAWVDFNLDW